MRKRQREAMQIESEEEGSVITDTSVLPRCQCTGNQRWINNTVRVSGNTVKCASVWIMMRRR
jgi:hypothetical protein